MLFVLTMSIIVPVQDAQAIVALAIPVIAVGVLACALVAGGAVGAYYQNPDGGYGGALYTSASNLYNSMSDNMRTDFNNAVLVAKSGYIALNTVIGDSTLYDFLHAHFIANDYTSGGGVTPTLSYLFDPVVNFTHYTYLQYSCASTSGTNVAGYVRVFEFASTVTTFIPANATEQYQFICNYNISSGSNGILTHIGNIVYDGLSYNGSPILTTYDALAMASYITSLHVNGAISNLYLTSGHYYNDTSVMPNSSSFTGILSAPIDTSMTVPNEIPLSGKVAVPSNPTQLDQAIPSTNLVTSAGTVANPSVTSDQAIAGDTASEISTSTDTFTNASANSKEGDSISWEPLKLAVDVFTNRFPFSLPWDFLHMVTTFASAPVTPLFSMVANSGVVAGFKLNTTMDLSQYNDVVATVRIFEKILFTIGLLWGTRKLVGGAA